MTLVEEREIPRKVKRVTAECNGMRVGCAETPLIPARVPLSHRSGPFLSHRPGNTAFDLGQHYRRKSLSIQVITDDLRRAWIGPKSSARRRHYW